MFKMKAMIKSAAMLGCALAFAGGSIGLCHPLLYYQGGWSVLLSPEKTAAYVPIRLQQSFTSLFSHGYLIQFRSQVSSAGTPDVYLTNSSGQLVHSVAIWPHGTSHLLLNSVDVGADGRLAVAGQETNTGGSVSFLIARSDLDGKDPMYFSTGNFCAAQIAVADDGSIWAVGAEAPESSQAPNAATKRWENYDMLRHYSPTGTLLNSFIPRWGPMTAYVTQQGDASGRNVLHAYDNQGKLLAVYGPPFWGLQGDYDGPSVRTQTWLRALHNGAVLYDGRSGLLYWYSSSRHALTLVRVDTQYNNVGSWITGFAVTSDGRIIVTMNTLRSNRSPSMGRSGLMGFFQLMLPYREGLAAWEWIRPDRSGPRFWPRAGRVLGSDGTAIVYRTIAYRTGAHALSWSGVRTPNRPDRPLASVLTLGAVAQALTVKKPNRKIPSVIEDEPFKGGLTEKEWNAVVENHGSSSIDALLAESRCIESGTFLGITHEVDYDPLVHYGDDFDIPPGGAAEIDLMGGSNCRGGVKAVIFADGRSEGGRGDVQRMYAERQGVYRALGKSIALLNELTSGKITTQRAAAIWESWEDSGAMGNVNITSVSEISGARATYFMLRHQVQGYAIPSTAQARCVWPIPARSSGQETAKASAISCEQFNLILLDRKLHAWRLALEDHLKPPLPQRGAR